MPCYVAALGALRSPVHASAILAAPGMAVGGGTSYESTRDILKVVGEGASLFLEYVSSVYHARNRDYENHTHALDAASRSGRVRGRFTSNTLQHLSGRKHRPNTPHATNTSGWAERRSHVAGRGAGLQPPVIIITAPKRRGLAPARAATPQHASPERPPHL